MNIIIFIGSYEWVQHNYMKEYVIFGSVLRPLMFLIYMNDLQCGLMPKICKFADDTKLDIAADPLAVAQLGKTWPGSESGRSGGNTGK